MQFEKPIRFGVIGALLLLAAAWALASAATTQEPNYPNGELLATVGWLAEHRSDDDVNLVDVRQDEHFHGEVIPGAVRMPWEQFRGTDAIVGVTGVFVGVNEAERLLGEHGIARNDTVVLYDSVERDGGATASYIFWVLDMLGHDNVKILDGGIDAWKRAGHETSDTPAQPEPITYQAPLAEVSPKDKIEAFALYERLGDPYYQILDVRTRDEYLGEAPNVDWQGRVQKLGHIPGAYCVPYESNWIDAETKMVKPYEELLELYPGLSPSRAVVTYCHSARRSSYTYFILRLMGFEDLRLYDGSWMEWGKKDLYYPVETEEQVLQGALPRIGAGATRQQDRQMQQQQTGGGGGAAAAPSGGSGYISCGG
jgi:thiosulfate/3-mercaptopyruvate sulfurtransferase